MTVEQVGGDHYDATYEHWDYASETGLGYLEGCASKYVTRWRKKDGVQGLQKAISYLQKIKEMGITVCPPALNRPRRAPHKLDRFVNANGFAGACEYPIFVLIDAWETHDDLDKAIAYIRELINEQSAS